MAKEQVGHSYTFWTTTITIFNPVANFGQQSLNSLFPPVFQKCRLHHNQVSIAIQPVHTSSQYLFHQLPTNWMVWHQICPTWYVLITCFHESWICVWFFERKKNCLFDKKNNSCIGILCLTSIWPALPSNFLALRVWEEIRNSEWRKVFLFGKKKKFEEFFYFRLRSLSNLALLLTLGYKEAISTHGYPFITDQNKRQISWKLFMFPRFRIRENMWWTRYRPLVTCLRHEKFDVAMLWQFKIHIILL